MLERQYVEALLVDAVLADAVWALWDAGVITDADAARAWMRVAACLESGHSNNMPILRVRKR